MIKTELEKTLLEISEHRNLLKAREDYARDLATMLGEPDPILPSKELAELHRYAIALLNCVWALRTEVTGQDTLNLIQEVVDRAITTLARFGNVSCLAQDERLIEKARAQTHASSEAQTDADESREAPYRKRTTGPVAGSRHGLLIAAYSVIAKFSTDYWFVVGEVACLTPYPDAIEAIRKCLAKLVNAGVLLSEREDGRVFYCYHHNGLQAALVMPELAEYWETLNASVTEECKGL